jgi:hypothetical protein
MDTDETAGGGEHVRVWLVQRTYGDDEQNMIILTYATPDGRREFRKERALTSYTGDHRETPVSMTVDPDNLGSVDDEAERERYATEVERMRENHAPTDSL